MWCPQHQSLPGAAAEASKQYEKAERFYINAHKPELALKMYKRLGNWDQVMRVARQHTPKRVAELNAEHMEFMGRAAGPNSAEYHISQAKIRMAKHDYDGAVDAYLRVTQEHSDNADVLEKTWTEAVTVAMTHVPARTSQVVAQVRKNLYCGCRNDHSHVCVCVSGGREACCDWTGRTGSRVVLEH